MLTDFFLRRDLLIQLKKVSTKSLIADKKFNLVQFYNNGFNVFFSVGKDVQKSSGDPISSGLHKKLF